MKTATRSLPVWGIVPVVLAETAFCAVLAAWALDSLVRRPQQGGGSITTLLPGFVYASASVMKVCVVTVLLSAFGALAWWMFGRRAFGVSGPAFPRWGMASVALTPAAPLVGTLAVLGAQALASGPDVLSAEQFSRVARSGVFAMLAIIAGAEAAGVTSMLRRERPRALPILGLAANTVLIWLFWYCRFYALGFDQDLWAPR